MLRRFSCGCLLSIAMGAACLAASQQPATQQGPATTTSPTTQSTIWRFPKKTDSWIPLEIVDKERLEVHQYFVERAKKGDVDLLFLGDDILAGLEDSTEVWKTYEPLHAACFAFHNTLIENLLWRIDNGELENIHPKVIVLAIGTINTQSFPSSNDLVSGMFAPHGTLLVGRGTGETNGARAKGVQAIVDRIQKKLPDTKILLLSIPPKIRSNVAHSPQFPGKPAERAWTDKDATNKLVAKLDNGKSIRFVDIASAFVDKEANGLDDIYEYSRGYTLPTPASYKRIDALIRPLVDEMLKK